MGTCLTKCISSSRNIENAESVGSKETDHARDHNFLQSNDGTSASKLQPQTSNNLELGSPFETDILLGGSQFSIPTNERHKKPSCHYSNSTEMPHITLKKNNVKIQDSISHIPMTQFMTDYYQVSDNTLNALFEKYKDQQEDAILSEGIERLCIDLGYRPDDFPILVLAWRLKATQMCRFRKSEFIEGLKDMQADSISRTRLCLEQDVERLKTDHEMFKQLYRFTFSFGLEPQNRTVALDMAILLWRLVFTVQTPDILDQWLNFLEKHPHIRGVPKDTWNMFLNFAETCNIAAYDDTEAWPSLFDDFVEYETDRTNENVSEARVVNKSDNIDNINDSSRNYLPSKSKCSNQLKLS